METRQDRIVNLINKITDDGGSEMTHDCIQEDLEKFIVGYKKEKFQKPKLDNEGKPESLWGFPIVMVDEPNPKNN